MSLFKSIATFGSFTFLSRITGFLRDMVLANYLGAGLISDAFFVSFKLPNLFRSLFAEGAFTSAFVPMVSKELCKENGHKKAVVFSSEAISVLALSLAFFIFIIEFLMPYVVAILAPGFVNDSGKIELAITLSRLTFPFLLFISIVSFQSGILNSLGRFAAPASAPIILNLLMIAAAFAFFNLGPTPAHGIALGVTIAGFVEILWLNYFLRKEKVFLTPSFDIFNLIKKDSIKTLFKRMAPGILGSGIYQINVLVDTILASLIGTGAISWLYYANRIQQLPLGVVGAAISVALLPILSKHLQNNESDNAKTMQDKAIEYGALLSIPTTIAMIILAKPAINILFQHGKFGTFETEMTYRAIIAFALGLPFFVSVKALSQNFFARGDTKTPVKYSLITFCANLTLALILMKPFGHIGIASASTLSAVVSFFQYQRGLKKRDYWHFEKKLITTIIKIFVCSLIMGIFLTLGIYSLDVLFDDWLRFNAFVKLPLFLALVLLGVATFAFMAKIMGVLDIKAIIHTINRRGNKNVKK